MKTIVDLILDAYRSGMPIKDIAKKCDKDPRTIKKVLVEYGVKLRNKSECKKLSLGVKINA